MGGEGVCAHVVKKKYKSEHRTKGVPFDNHLKPRSEPPGRSRVRVRFFKHLRRENIVLKNPPQRSVAVTDAAAVAAG
jgi:hypothetical protein